MTAALLLLAVTIVPLSWSMAPRGAAGRDAPDGRADAESGSPFVREPVGKGRSVGVVVGFGSVGWFFVGGVPGIVAGAMVGVVAARRMGRAEPDPARELARSRDLPGAIGMVAALLRGGVLLPVALEAVGGRSQGAVGEELAAVARSLRLGAPAAVAWAPLLDDPVTQPLAGAVIRSEQSGAALVDVLQRMAVEAGRDHFNRAQVAARSAGVRVVLPLGLCFLPAFLLLAIVPTVAALLDGVALF